MLNEPEPKKYQMDKCSHEEVAKELMVSTPFMTWYESEQFAYYDEPAGKWSNTASTYVDSKIAKLVADSTRYFRNEVSALIKAEVRGKSMNLINDPYLVNLQNGIYDPHRQQFLPHNEKYYIMNQITPKYDPLADCPKIKAFLQKMQPDEASQEFLKEEVALCLIRSQKYQVSDMHIGAGNNGKTQWLDILRGFLGQNNFATAPLQSLSTNRFAAAQLEFKLANICGDISPKELFNTSLFKQITGGDVLQAEHKNQQLHNVDIYAMLVYACNILPETQDTTDAFFDRWRILQWTFTIPDEEIIDGLGKIIASHPEEMSGLFNWVKPKLDVLAAGERPKQKGSVDEIREMWLSKSDSVQAFIEKLKVTADKNDKVTREEIKTLYHVYCKKVKVMPKSNTELYDALRLVRGIGETQHKNQRSFLGIQIHRQEGLDAHV